MSLAVFNVTVPLDGAVILPPEFAGQEIRIVIETPSKTVAEEERGLTKKEKRERAWQDICRIGDSIQARMKHSGMEPPSEEEVMAMIKADRRAEGEALRRAKEETTLCTN